MIVPFPQLQELAQSLIDTPQKKIDNTVALNREEKQQINDARAKANVALKTLNNPQATVKEKNEAEKNLRQAVADAKPALNKLANTLDKGIITVVGQWFKNIMDFLNAYKGNESDKKQAIVWHSKMDSTVNVLSKRTEVPADLMKAMTDAHQNAQPAWTNLEKGTDGIRPKGPGADFEEGYTPEDIALCKTNAEKTEVVEKYLSLPKPKVNCVSSHANLGKIFKAPDGTNVTLENNDIPLAFFAKDEGELYGRLASFKRNDVIYIYNYRRNDWKFTGIWQVYESTHSSTEGTPLRSSNSEGKLVKLEKSGECPENFKYYYILEDVNVVGEKGGDNYLAKLGEKAGKSYQEDAESVSANTSYLYDYANVIEAAEKKKVIDELKSSARSIGVAQKIFVTDVNTPADKKKVIENYLNNLSKEIDLWIDFNKDKIPTIKIKVGSSIQNANSPESNKFIEKMAEILPTCKQEGDSNPLTLILDGIAGVISQAKVDEKYYDPDNRDYNPFPSKVFGIIERVGIPEPPSEYAHKYDDVLPYTESRRDFALVCGVYNGTVDLVGAVPAVTSLLIKLIVNENHTLDTLWKQVTEIKWDSTPSYIGDKWEKYKSANPCKKRYIHGEAIFFVASCAVGAAELRVTLKAAKAGKKLLSQFTSSILDDAAVLTMKQKGTHIFANKLHPKPYLDQLANQLGGQQILIRSALEAGNGRFPASGIFELPVTVGGQNLIIRGFVNNGRPIINTIFK